MASSLTISEEPKLEDLPELCLDRVLTNLSFEDLIRASISNELLAASAFRVFTLQFKNDEIIYWLRDQKFLASIKETFKRFQITCSRQLCKISVHR